jgi:hypothetical protein
MDRNRSSTNVPKGKVSRGGFGHGGGLSGGGFAAHFIYNHIKKFQHIVDFIVHNNGYSSAGHVKFFESLIYNCIDFAFMRH